MTETGLLLADSGQEGSGTVPALSLSGDNAEGNGAQTDEKIDREQLLAINSDLIRTLHRRISGRRFRSNQHDGTRLAIARALVQAITAHNQVLRDMEMEELDRRIAALEEAKK